MRNRETTSGVDMRELGEDILHWMGRVSLELSEDHAMRSPHCHPEELKETMIPLTGERIGEPWKR